MKVTEYYCDMCGGKCNDKAVGKGYSDNVYAKQRYYAIHEKTPHIDYGWLNPYDKTIHLCPKCYNKIDDLIESLHNGGITEI